MQEEIIELIVQALVFVSYTATAVVVSALGLFFEYRSYLFSNSGEMVLSVWLAGLGVLMFAFAIRIGRDKLPGAYSALSNR